MAGNGLERRAGNEVVLCLENPVSLDVSSDKNCHPVTLEGMGATSFVDAMNFTMFYKMLIIRHLSTDDFSWHEQCLTKPRL
ncbi:hypothetical protein [Marinobacter salarius]|uniref:hypothetical protein n=1 Tax=Marinobacter salarius TaxID=1420917 RepID=UPI000F857377|nr:hypothetical protein [Marinobacter salarius]AZR42355.1 hypothetical protein MTMN5_02907 [Marinobacter salarius]